MKNDFVCRDLTDGLLADAPEPDPAHAAKEPCDRRMELVLSRRP